MNLHLPRVGVALLAIFTVLGAALTLYLIPRFGGPGINLSDTYTLNAAFPDAQQVEKKSVVLVRGVKVGTVEQIETVGDRAMVKMHLYTEYAPVHRDASIRIGQRTAIGDAYVDLNPGTRRAGDLDDGGTVARVNPTVEFDEAYTALDKPARTDAVKVLKTFGRGARSPATAQRWGATVSRLSATVHELGRLTGTLRGQGRYLSELVGGSRVALRELGSRQAALQRLVADGRRTLSVFSGRRRDFAESLRELPALLRTARSTLAQAEPLLREARPVVDDLTAASPQLRRAFADLRPFSTDLRATVAGLPAFNETATPFLRDAVPVLDDARPFARRLFPALQNLVPMARHLAPRGREFAAWFANTGGAGQQHDSKGNWIRFNTFNELATAAGSGVGPYTRNAYKQPGDALDPQPYVPGSYPRLLPFKP